MNGYRRVMRSWRGTLGVLLVVGASTLLPLTVTAQTLVQFDESSIAKGAVVFQRGVFRIDNDGKSVTPLCIPVQGRWKQVGTSRDCGDSPPQEQQREISRFSPDMTYLGVRNLGVSSDQWEAVKKARAAGGANTVLRQVGDAFSYSVTSTDTRWRFDTAKLPPELKADIPGSGIQVHFGGVFSDDRRLALDEKNGSVIEIEARFAVPVFAHTGKAHAGLSLAVDLDLPTVKGDYVTMPLIVDLLHPDGRGREHVGSDGRVNFATTWLAPGNRYVQMVEDPEHLQAWSSPERFVFRLSTANVAQVASELNKRRAEAGAPAIDERSLDRTKIAGVTLRNELRFLRQGDVLVEVVVDYLRVSRVMPRR
jgi:hypothetical protein